MKSFLIDPLTTSNPIYSDSLALINENINEDVNEYSTKRAFFLFLCRLLIFNLFEFDFMVCLSIFVSSLIYTKLRVIIEQYNLYTRFFL